MTPKFEIGQKVFVIEWSSDKRIREATVFAWRACASEDRPEPQVTYGLKVKWFGGPTQREEFGEDQVFASFAAAKRKIVRSLEKELKKMRALGEGEEDEREDMPA